MVPHISINYSNRTSFELSERAEKVEISQIGFTIKYADYEISNIYNPSVRYSFFHEKGNLDAFFVLKSI
uniref:Uncharacterized protein n=1 Tax=Meloidogyne enterolobii TaxID=390850 RepID=A0A6V7VZE2_MELEN|nr:unnamed protein product [Meloidogyne enterolobii]CAD2180306.1 unnamed protein product [Meloidogyne enterolobii]